MDVPVWIYRPGQDKPEKHTLTAKADADGAASYAGTLREFVRGVIRKQRADAYEEHVTVLFDGERRDMFVDEFGSTLGLPVNDAATQIYWAASKARGEAQANLELHAPRIYGVAILFPKHQVWR